MVIWNFKLYVPNSSNFPSSKAEWDLIQPLNKSVFQVLFVLPSTFCFGKDGPIYRTAKDLQDPTGTKGVPALG